MPRPELSTLRYPNLWQGCVGAWCPSQSGATGYRLFDDSGNNNHGTLTGMDPGTDWVPSGGKLALDFDGVNDFVASASSKQFADLSTDSLTFSFWNKNDTGTTGIYAGLTNSTNSNAFFWTQASGTQIYFGHRNNSGGDSGITTGVWQSATWRLLTLVSTPASITVYQNGLQLGTTSRTASATTLNVMTLGCANRANTQNNFAITQLDDARVYNRALTPSEIRLLYTGGRGAAYERSRGRKKAYVPGYRITAPSRIQTGSARTIDGTDTESLSRGLIGAWCPSLGASGFRLIDRSGYGNHGTLTNMDPGTDWVPSGGKLALDFDGTNDYVNISANFSRVATSKRFTYSCWIKTSSANNNAYPFSFGSTSSDSPIIGFRIDPGGTGQVIVLFRDDAGNTAITTPGSASILDGTWKLLTGVADGSDVTMFVNGVQYGFSGSCTPLSTVNLNRASVGALGRTSVLSYFNGQEDDCRLYDRALTPQEIRLLYTGGRGVGLLPEAKPKRARIVAWDNQDKISVPARVLTNTDSLKRGLVGHWSPSLSGPQGNRLMDLSGQNNHGTLTNMDYQTDYVPSAEKGGRMALDFDGSNDGVSVGSFNMNTLNNSNNCVSLWLNPTTTNTISRPFAVGEFGTGFALRFNFQNLEFTFGGTAVLSVSMNNASYAGKWTHILGVADNSGARLFFNGVQVGTRSDTVGITKTIGLGIGYRFGVNSDYFTGQLDDIRIYNRALTPSEIRLLAQSRMPERATPQRTRTVFYSSGLVSYLRRRTYNSILGSGVLS